MYTGLGNGKLEPHPPGQRPVVFSQTWIAFDHVALIPTILLEIWIGLNAHKLVSGYIRTILCSYR